MLIILSGFFIFFKILFIIGYNFLYSSSDEEFRLSFKELSDYETIKSLFALKIELSNLRFCLIESFITIFGRFLGCI
jgi:hypothetical protein